MSRVWGRRQLRKSDEQPHLCDGHAPRPEIHILPSHEGVSTEDVPAVRLDCRPEVRRRDVGVQRYGSGVPTLAPGCHEDSKSWFFDKQCRADGPGQSVSIHQTAIGPIKLSDPHPRRDLGEMPTVDTIDFLKHECQGSRFNPPKLRFYS